jgi:acyl-CoA synthetase (AMP-forming)/AMP-acid ligase II
LGAAQRRAGDVAVTPGLSHHIGFQAHTRPHALAVFGAAGPVTFQTLQRDVDALATELLEHGLSLHDMVGLHLDFCYLHLLLVLALDRLDIPSMSFQIAGAASAPPVVLPQFGVTAIVSSLAAPAPPPCRWITMTEPHRPRLGTPDAARLAALGRSGDRLLRVTWTSGTTGAPKGSPMTRAVQDLRLNSLRLVRGLGPATRYLLGMPLSSGYAYAMALAVLAAGGAVIVPTPPGDPIDLADALAVTATGGSPAMLVDLMGRGGDPLRRFASLRYFDVVGAQLPSRLAREARAHLTPNLWTTYGSTEGGWAATAEAAVCLAEPHAVGYVLPWIAVEIVDAAGRPVPAGRDGTVRLRGPQIVMRYHGDDADAASVFRDGWFHPGDLGSLGADGLLRITGRIEEAIRLDGAAVSPLPLEEALRGVPGVRDVAVFALAAGATELVAAALVLDPGIDPARLRDDVTARLGARAPTRLMVVDQLPRNPHGKVLRRELAERARRHWPS